jgi:sortase A
MQQPGRVSPPPARRAGRLLLVFETLAWTLGLVCATAWGALSLDGAMGARRELQRFATVHAAAGQASVLPPGGTPDQSLWSAARVAAWRGASEAPAPPPLAVLRIPKIQLEVAVLPGTDDHTLNRAVGLIEGTAPPGTPGNAGIAGHRDGFFRGLKDIGPGDALELETSRGKEVYRVERTWIVGPEDVSVLDATPTPAVTLVTCYPFYFVGPAPERFIVRAVPARPAAPGEAQR